MKRSWWLGALPLALGCAREPAFSAVDPSSGRSVALTPAALRPGQSFTGAYRSPQSGKLELVQFGDRLEGSYRYSVCSCTLAGTLSGSVEGNFARLSFSERYLDCEAGRELHGEGFLFYRRPPGAGSVAELYGSRVYHRLHPSLIPSRYLGESRSASVWTATGIAVGSTVAEPDNHCP